MIRAMRFTTLTIGLLLMLCALAFAAQPFGMTTCVEATDFRSETYGSATLGKSIQFGPYFRITDDIRTFAVVDYGTNKTDSDGKAEVLSGFAGAEWDILDLYAPRNVELGLLFEAGASSVDVTGFDPATNFGWVSGAFLSFQAKNSPVTLQLYGRLVSVKDALKPAVGIKINVPLLTNTAL